MRNLILFFLLFLNGPLAYSSGYDFGLSYILDHHILDSNEIETTQETVGILIARNSYEVNKFRFQGDLILNHSTGSPTDRLGDAQIVSNIDTEGGEGLKPYQILLGFKENHFLFRAGLIDLATDFNITESSLTLINSSFGTAAEFGAAGAFGPAIYPVPSWGVTAFYEKEHQYHYAALMDPVSEEGFDVSNMVTEPRLDDDHHLLVYELGFKDLFSINKAGLGLWKIKDLREGVLYKQQGVYFQAEKTFSIVETFLRLSRSFKISQKLYQNIVAGAVLREAFFKEASFHLGFSRASIESRQNKESVYEALYEFNWNPVKTSVSYQHIQNLAGQNSNGEVLTLRLSVSL